MPDPIPTTYGTTLAPLILPNTSAHFQDPEMTPTQVPRARGVLNHIDISKSDKQSTYTEPAFDQTLRVQVIALTFSLHRMLQKIKQLERVARNRAKAPPTGYSNDTAFVRKRAIRTTEVVDLEA